MRSLRDIEQATPWIPTWHETGACMDRRHILWLNQVLLHTGVKRTLEIGIHSGASSSAFLKAQVAEAHFCDVTLRGDAMSLLQGFGLMHKAKGCDVLREQPRFELVFVDGCHSEACVLEEVAAMRDRMPDILVAHDINSTAVGFGECEGAHSLWAYLQGLGWTCVVDARDRPGEMTKRGMLVATKNPDYAAVALGTWRDVQ